MSNKELENPYLVVIMQIQLAACLAIKWWMDPVLNHLKTKLKLFHRKKNETISFSLKMPALPGKQHIIEKI